MPPVEREAAVSVRDDVDVVEVAGSRPGAVCPTMLVHEAVVVALELRVEVAREEVEAVGEAVREVELRARGSTGVAFTDSQGAGTVFFG